MQDSGSSAMFKVTARDQGHYKGPSGAFVTYCNISCFFSGNSCYRPPLVNTQIKGEKKEKEKRSYVVNMFQTRTMARAMIPQMMMMMRMT